MPFQCPSCKSILIRTPEFNPVATDRPAPCCGASGEARIILPGNVDDEQDESSE